MSKTPRSRKRRIQFLVIAALVLFPALLLLSGRALYLEFERTAELEAGVHRSYETRSQIQNVFSLLQDAETGQRGYVITGEERFLQPYREAARDLTSQLEKLSALLEQRPKQLEDFARLQRLAGGELAVLENGIIARAVHGTEGGLAFVSSGVGKAVMDEIRPTIDRMIQREADALEKNVRAEHARTERTEFLVAALFTSLIVLVTIIAVLIWRYSSARERLLTEIQSVVARQHAIFDGAIDGIITLNPSGTIETVNAAAERMFGYAASELDRRDVSILIDVGNGNRPFLSRIGAAEGAISSGIVRELTARRRDGTTFPVAVALGAMQLPTGTHIVATVRNISERRRIDQMKNEFISTVSHELRTPLTSIAGSLALLVGGAAGELSDKATRLTSIAHANSQRLVRLVNNILDIERIESGEFKLNFALLDLREIAQRSIDSVQGYANELSVRQKLKKGPSTPVRGDADRLIQVVTNLLSNACKFSPAGAGVTVSVAREGYVARLSVTDRGPGISEEFRSRIFSRFAQAEGPNMQVKGGTGLGLVIAREISDLHGGRLWFESKPGGGTTFHVDLPLWIAAEEIEPVRLLVCEGNKDKAAILRSILERDGFSIDMASTSDEALRKLSVTNYAATLIDLHLPGADSVGLIRTLRAQPATRKLPIVLISAAADAETIEGQSLVVVDWLEKPVDSVRLTSALAASLNGGRSNRPLILHVDDDPDILQVTSTALADVADVIPAQNLLAARAALSRRRPDLVILDLALADGSGPDLLGELGDKLGRTIPVVIYSAQETEPDLVKRVDAVLTKSKSSLTALTQTIRRLIVEKEERSHAHS